MNESISFSIIVPTYNRAHLITSTINSIINQTYKNFELIIVDDGSTDNTEEVIQKYLSDKVFYYKKNNQERAAARNFGTLKAKGDYVNWFDSDDIMTADNLCEAAAKIAKYGKVELLVQGFEYRNMKGDITFSSNFSEDINKEMYRGNQIANSPVIVRRDIALAHPFNEDRELSGSEDYELWLRLGARYKFYTSDRKTVTYIIHDERSTTVMSDPGQLILRFTKFIHYTTTNDMVVQFLKPHLQEFMMKNYTLLAVDLMIKGYKKKGLKYLSKAAFYSPRLILERGFYAFIKYFTINVFKIR